MQILQDPGWTEHASICHHVLISCTSYILVCYLVFLVASTGTPAVGLHSELDAEIVTVEASRSSKLCLLSHVPEPGYLLVLRGLDRSLFKGFHEEVGCNWI